MKTIKNLFTAEEWWTALAIGVLWVVGTILFYTAYTYLT